MGSLGIHGQDPNATVDAEITTLPNEGQQTMANSISVAIASDQSVLDTDALTDAELRAAPVVISGAVITL